MVVQSIDWLGRNCTEILEQWSVTAKRQNAAIVVLDMPLPDTRQGRDLTGVLISDMVLQLLSYVAQKERESIQQRQKPGAYILDRWHSLCQICLRSCIRRGAAEKMSLREAADACGMPKSTFYDAALRTEASSGSFAELYKRFGRRSTLLRPNN